MDALNQLLYAATVLEKEKGHLRRRNEWLRTALRRIQIQTNGSEGDAKVANKIAQMALEKEQNATEPPDITRYESSPKNP